jgi:hypothetical protein
MNARRRTSRDVAYASGTRETIAAAGGEERSQNRRLRIAGGDGKWGGGEGLAMRMEFSRMTGVFISQRPWAVDGKSTDELVTDAKHALSGFYDGDEYAFWPKEEYASNAPEHVRVVDSTGAIVVEYDLAELAAESKRSLIAGRGALRS